MHLIEGYNTVRTNTAQRGIYILIKKSLGQVENINIIDNSTLIFDIRNSDNKTLRIACIYATSDADNKYYFEEVDNLIQARAISSDFQMLIGDYNTTLNCKRDRHWYSNTTDTHKKL